jgi:hypothetical protein
MMHARAIQPHLSSPMLPVDRASPAAQREMRRLPCVHEPDCIAYVAKRYPTAVAAQCPEACERQCVPSERDRVYHATRSGQYNTDMSRTR